MLHAHWYYSEYKNCLFFTIYNIDSDHLCTFFVNHNRIWKYNSISIIMQLIRQQWSDSHFNCLCINQIFWNNKIICQTFKTTYVTAMLFIFQGRGISMKSNFMTVSFILFSEHKGYFIALFYLIFIQVTCITSARRIVWCFFTKSWSYTWSNSSTKFRTLEELVIFNWFKFLTTKKMTGLVLILDVTLEGIILEWIIFAVSIIRVYPFKFLPMQLELTIVPMIISLP